jgi:hypothetical protein
VKPGLFTGRPPLNPSKEKVGSQSGNYLQADEMDMACITRLSVTYRNVFVRTGNAAGSKNIQAISFRMYRMVNKTGFIKKDF